MPINTGSYFSGSVLSFKQLANKTKQNKIKYSKSKIKTITKKQNSVFGTVLCDKLMLLMSRTNLAHVLYCTVLHCTPWNQMLVPNQCRVCYTILYCLRLHYTILYCTVLRCIRLYYTVTRVESHVTAHVECSAYPVPSQIPTRTQNITLHRTTSIPKGNVMNTINGVITFYKIENSTKTEQNRIEWSNIILIFIFFFYVNLIYRLLS